MSDNTTLDAMAGGDVIASDDVNGVKYQRVKVSFGADGFASDVSPNNPLPISQAPAVNQWGQALSVAPGETATLAAIGSSRPGYSVRGLIATGRGEGYFFLQVDALTVLSGRLRLGQPNLVLVLPNAIHMDTNSTVTLQVTNEASSATDFEATLLGA